MLTINSSGGFYAAERLWFRLHRDSPLRALSPAALVLKLEAEGFVEARHGATETEWRPVRGRFGSRAFRQRVGRP